MENKQATITISQNEFSDCTLADFKEIVSNSLCILTEYVKEINEDDFRSIAEPLNIIHRSIKEMERETFLLECRKGGA